MALLTYVHQNVNTYSYVQHYPKDERVLSLMKEIEPVFLPYNVHTITKLDKSELPPPVPIVPTEEKKQEEKKNDESKKNKQKNTAGKKDDSNKEINRERRGGSDARVAARERRASQKV